MEPEMPMGRKAECLDGKFVLKGGSKEDRLAAHEWMSLFWHEAVLRDGGGRQN